MAWGWEYKVGPFVGLLAAKKVAVGGKKAVDRVLGIEYSPSSVWQRLGL